ncbi:MAG TPA: hypothetical protein PK979_02870 [Bacteroidales bacterium]|nr:hypothetical protein [Bacteroidales bacterium]
MKFKLYIFALLALSVISCTREPLPELEKEEGKIVTISATIPPETRVAYNDTTLKLSWQTGDTLLLAGYDGETYIGRKKFGWTGTGCTFSGEEVPGATTYKAYYPGNVITLDHDGNVKFPDNFWDQRQNGDSTTAHLRNKLLLFDEETHSITQIFNLTLKSSIIKLDLSSVPKEVGKLHQLVYTVETASGVFESVSLDVSNVTSSLAKHSLLAFLAFDPAVTKITANGKVIIRLKGDKLYQCTQSVALGKDYVAGHRYTGAVSSGWADITTPLYYVAEYNVNEAGTGFVTDLIACEVSGYFNWSNAVTHFNTNKIISGYHLPSIEEWQGIVPLYANQVYCVRFDSAPPSNGVTELVVVQGQNITMTGDFSHPGNNVSYALRYKGTDMVSAWKYEYISDGNNTHMTITSRRVSSSVTIDDITENNGAFWNSGNENDIVRYFPASGYYEGSLRKNLGINGYFWSSTKKGTDFAFAMTFRSSDASSSSGGYWKTNRYTVRLFTPEN